MDTSNSSEMRRSRILLADDDAMFREGFAALVRSDGYECVCAADGTEALELLRQSRFDVLISDIFMPGNVNLELIEGVQQYAAGLPVFLLTGRPAVETAVKAVNLSVAGYVVKPPDWTAIRPLLDRAIEGYRTFRKIAEHRQKFEHWAQDLARIERLMKDPQTADKAMPIAQYLQLTASNLALALDDMEQMLELFVRLRSRGGALEDQPLLEALQRTMETLEETRQSFKSKRLARLRVDLERVLRERVL